VPQISTMIISISIVDSRPIVWGSWSWSNLVPRGCFL